LTLRKHSAAGGDRRAHDSRQIASLVPTPNPRLPLDILHVDSQYLIVNKSPGMVSQPGLGHIDDTVLNAAFGRYGHQLRTLGARRDWGLLHRLDKPTSGAMVLALTPESYDHLRLAFQERKVKKEYLALVCNRPTPPSGKIEARLAETDVGFKKVVISAAGQDALTYYWTLASSSQASLVRIEIITGRLHQIRAHMMFAGSSLIGDSLYPQPGMPAGRGDAFYLHCRLLQFAYPQCDEPQRFLARLPAGFVSAAQKLGIVLPRSLQPVDGSDAMA
jgi:23S rRNA pseudouridine1911/1915/1917 synthase